MADFLNISRNGFGKVFLDANLKKNPIKLASEVVSELTTPWLNL